MLHYRNMHEINAWNNKLDVHLLGGREVYKEKNNVHLLETSEKCGWPLNLSMFRLMILCSLLAYMVQIHNLLMIGTFLMMSCKFHCIDKCIYMWHVFLCKKNVISCVNFDSELTYISGIYFEHCFTLHKYSIMHRKSCHRPTFILYAQGHIENVHG